MDARGIALEELYHARYSNFRHGIAAALGDYDEAHDAVQEGFARAFAERNRFRGGSLEAWTWRIVWRKALDLRRGRRTLPVERDFDAGFIRSDRDPELANAIRALPDRRRLIVFLRYYADLSYDAIAEICGVSPGTVAAALSQAHAELRKTLELEGVER